MNRHKHAVVDHTYPKRWNVIKRDKRKDNDPWCKARFGCICSGTNLRSKYSNEFNNNYNYYAYDNDDITEYSGRNYRNTSLHEMLTRSMKPQSSPINDNCNNNGLSFDDDNEYVSNWIMKDNTVEFGKIYDNDSSNYLLYIENKIEQYDIDTDGDEEEEEEYIQDFDNNNDEYIPMSLSSFKKKEVRQEESDVESDVSSVSSMDYNDYVLSMKVENEMNIYDEETDDLYEKITLQDITTDKAAQKENEDANRMDLQRNNEYRHSGYCGIRKPHRYRPGTVALREIRRYQNSAKLLISKSEFERCVGSIVYKHYPHNIKFQQSAIYALQQGVESFMVDVFNDSNLCAIHSKRVNVCPKDIQIAIRIREKKAHID